VLVNFTSGRSILPAAAVSRKLGNKKAAGMFKFQAAITQGLTLYANRYKR